jgi:hypothetical protein
MNMEHTPTSNDAREIEISISPLNYDPDRNVSFTPTFVKVSSLRDVFTNHNYSPIKWADNYREQIAFRSAAGFCIDIDHGQSIQEAEAKLREAHLNYALITTKSHSEVEHRFHIFIPFNYTLHSLLHYQATAHKLAELLGNKCDPIVFDGARFLFGSPTNAYFSSNWNGNDFDVSQFIGLDLSNMSSGEGDWDDNLVVTNSIGESLRVNQITEKTVILCPFHNDKHASAFISYSENSDNWFIHCSACARTFWKTKRLKPPEERQARFWSHSTSIYEVGIASETFYFSEIGEKKYYTLIGAKLEEEKRRDYEWLVKHHHLPKLARIDFLGDAFAEKPSVNILKDEGVIEVRYPPIAVNISDNDFIEQYLKNTFGEYSKFIKEYMAVYVYSNYRKLPTIILVGERGVGKNVFADLIADIYKPLSIYWKPEEGNFNPELQKKLLIGDEAVTRDVKNYTYLKRLSGQSYQTINEKYTPKYQVRNNTNIILLSNKILPIFTEREELPKNTFNNQFFVYHIKPFTDPIDAKLSDKLRDRLGNYVRTELLQVYKTLTLDKSRYSIETPITEDEIRLFGSSVSIEEALSEKFIRDLVENFSAMLIHDVHTFFQAGYLPFDQVCRELSEMKINISIIEKNKILHSLREHELIEPSRSDRIQIKYRREYCYKMTKKMQDLLQSELGNGYGLKEQPLEQPRKAA